MYLRIIFMHSYPARNMIVAAAACARERRRTATTTATAANLANASLFDGLNAVAKPS